MRYSHLIFILSAFIVGILFAIIDTLFQSKLVVGINIVGSAIIITIIFIFQYYYRRRNGDIFGSIDKDIFKIILSFLKQENYTPEDILQILKSIFKSYSPALTEKLFHKYYKSDINLMQSCTSLKNTKSDAKLFILYALFDIASKNKIITKQEERFIDSVRKWMRVHIKTVKTIRQVYKNKGIRSENEIIEEEARRKTDKEITKSFLPYNAYKILGVSPTVTKNQLRKVYRTLAKKYHPDKFHGQNEDVIQQMEDKFHEVTEAYEIVKKFGLGLK